MTDKHKPLDTILVDSFGEVFVELLKEKKITGDQFQLLLARTQEKITKNLAIELRKRTEELDKLKEEVLGKIKSN